MKVKYSLRSLILSALALPVGLFVGKSVEFVLKSLNPANVNITSGLAYLAPILLSTIIVVLVFWIMAITYVVLARKDQEDPRLIKIAFLTVVAVIFLTVLSTIVNGAVNSKIEHVKLSEQSSKR